MELPCVCGASLHAPRTTSLIDAVSAFGERDGGVGRKGGGR